MTYILLLIPIIILITIMKVHKLYTTSNTKLSDSDQIKRRISGLISWIIIAIFLLLALFAYMYFVDGPDIFTKLLKSGKECSDASTCTPLCKNLMPDIKYVSIIITILKILIPVLIIGKGIKNLLKTKYNPESTKRDITIKLDSLLSRILVGLIIFILPMLTVIFIRVYTTYDYLNGNSSKRIDFRVCESCLLNPSNCN